MAGDNRKVDSVVLRDLASATQAKRDRLDTFYRACRSRVDAAPRRWNTGEWDGTPSFMRFELEQMDRERQELADRAWKNDIVSAIANLAEPLPLSAWKFLLAVVAPVGLMLGATRGAAQDLVATVARFVGGFAKAEGRKPTAAEISTGTGTIAKPTASTGPATPSTGLGSGKPSAAVDAFALSVGNGRLPDGECVTLAKAWIQKEFHVAPFVWESGWGCPEPGGPVGAWNAYANSPHPGFNPGEWDRITSNQTSTEYRTGDVVFFPGDSFNRGFGHVAIVAEVNGDRIRVVEQNFPKNSGVRSDRWVPRSSTLGVMHRKGDNT